MAMTVQEAHDSTALEVRPPRDVVLMPVMDVALAKKRLEELQAFCAGYLQESHDGGTDGGDYGLIPGAGPKKVLLKSGAEKLCDVYGLADDYLILSKVEDFSLGLFDYTIECRLTRKSDGLFVGSGLGSCSTYESKYRWRMAGRRCPSCARETIIKGKAEFGGGWVCLKSKGGCGAKFADTHPAITGQKVGRTENPDIIDTKNTVLKMAKKRAKIDAVIGVTRSSGLFTQDVEEHDDGPRDEPDGPPAAPLPPPTPPVPPVITAAQRTKFWATAKEHGWTKDEVKTLLANMGIGSSTDIPRDRFETLIFTLESGAAKPEAQP